MGEESYVQKRNWRNQTCDVYENVRKNRKMCAKMYQDVYELTNINYLKHVNTLTVRVVGVTEIENTLRSRLAPSSAGSPTYSDGVDLGCLILGDSEVDSSFKAAVWLETIAVRVGPGCVIVTDTDKTLIFLAGEYYK